MRLKTFSRLSDIAKQDWDRFNPSKHPFLAYDFLLALEESQSVCPQTGWQPHHIALISPVDQKHQPTKLQRASNPDANLAFMPVYFKTHSHGEYVFDYAWAEAWQRHQRPYYSKLLSAVPFTPVVGPRCLTNPDMVTQQAGLKKTILQGVKQLVDTHNLSGGHVNFLAPDEQDIARQSGYALRMHHQYHWFNQGYQNFDDFLGELTSRKRKTIRKERQKLSEMGIRFEQKSGADLTETDWDHFYRFYTSTYDRKWGVPYLTRSFFSKIGEKMADQILMVFAIYDDFPVAGALNFFNDSHLYGRNWGCDLRFKFLHFECCYYQAIDFAIARNIQIVEAGTQGEHKIQRGYQPVRTWSAHYMQDREFHHAVQAYVSVEQQRLDNVITDLSTLSPFRQTN